MQFTPQQLAGGGRYSFKTKIGNWSEEKALEEIMLQDFLARKGQGSLLSLKESSPTALRVRLLLSFGCICMSISFLSPICLRGKGGGG